MSKPNWWRNTGRRARFFFFDAKAALPLLLFLVHIRLWTFVIAVLSFLIFGVLEKFGLTIEIVLRMIRSSLAGPIRYGVAWWHKSQRKFKSGGRYAGKKWYE